MMKKKNRRLYLKISLLFLLIIVAFWFYRKFYSTTSTSSLDLNVASSSSSLLLKLNQDFYQNFSMNETEILLDFCNLTEIYPWDSTIMEFIEPEKDHMLECKPKIFQHSKLIDGQLFIYSSQSMAADTINCEMRCLFPEGDRSLIVNNWGMIKNGTKPKCDIVEVQCWKSAEKEEAPFYKYLHAQIYRNLSKAPLSLLPPETRRQKFDVHIIVLDSVSHTQFIRSMPKTLYHLRENYEAIPFRHLNKININSYANGFAFLIGKMVESIPKSLFSRECAADFPDVNVPCMTPLDEEQFIGFRFQDDGYMTLMAEDWAKGVFNWPNCKGFVKTPMDHYMRPFQLRTEKAGDNPKEMETIILENSCREYHYDIMDYLKNFLKAYPDKPKFSISWMSYLTHDFQNALSSSDDYFSKFFSETQKHFENSFLFVMGDHGLRFGEIRETNIGEMEDNNPALFISVPKELRNDPRFMHKLKLNSKELITHYDIYATLNEISKPTNPKHLNPVLHGSSLFHPLPYPRTCDSLRIPFEYCNCRAERIVLQKNNTIGIPAAKLMVQQMNFNLSSSNETIKVCSKLSLDKSASIIVEDYGGESFIRIYKITFSTLPGNGKFSGTVLYNSRNGKFKIFSSKFSRLNEHGYQSKCALTSKMASYCFCKNFSYFSFLFLDIFF